MKEIKLTKGKHCLVDDEDFDYLNQFKWQFGSHGYAQRFLARAWPKKPSVLMHREIMNPGKLKVDHISGNKLDNRRQNLRICDDFQNARNASCSKSNPTKLKGVSKFRSKYRARITVNGKEISLGHYRTAKQAAWAYDQAARRYFKEFAKLNFPDNEDWGNR